MDTATKKSENKNTSAGDDDADSRSSSESRGTLSALCSPNTPTPPSSPVVGKPHSSRLVKQRCGLGPRSKFKLIEDGDIQLCRLNHTRTIISKIMNSKYLRRWEMHHLIFGPNEVSSTTVCK